MKANPGIIPIPFERLHYYLQHDPFYGIDVKIGGSGKGPPESIDQETRNYAGIRQTILQIQQQYGDLEAHREIEISFRSLPCKQDTQRYLLLLFCGALGLAATRENQRLQWRARDFLENWTGHFDLNLIEVRDLLRKHNWPLPVHLFANAKDNTERILALGEEEYEAQAEVFNVILPKLESDLEELRGIQPENMAALKAKNQQVVRLERQIFALRSDPKSCLEETSTERQLRLKSWYREECNRCERGALKRTAEREGISHQTLKAILNRESPSCLTTV